MPHPEREHELQIALATALRERDEAREQTHEWLRAVEKLRENLNATLLERDALRAALEAATNALFSARNMLQAINEGDPTPDRKRAADRAWEAEKAARAALAGGGDRGR